MNKEEEARQRLDALEHEVKELRRIIKDDGFDWEFGKYSFCAGSDGYIYGLDCTTRALFFLPNISKFNDIETAKQMARIHAFNSLLMQFAVHCNPDGWKPDWSDDSDTYQIYISHKHKQLEYTEIYSAQTLTPTFSSYESVNKAIDILNANKERWWRLVFDGEPK